MKEIFLFFFLFYSTNTALSQERVIIPQDHTMTKDIVKLYRKSTISIGIEKNDTIRESNGNIQMRKRFIPIGTGVIFYIKHEQIVIPCIITAKHVIFQNFKSWKPDSINIRFSSEDTIGLNDYVGHKLALYDKKFPLWISHQDSTIDLACIPLNPRTDAVKRFYPLPYNNFAKSEDFFEGKEIFVLGYPSAIGVDQLNKAFLRKGIIAWVPETFPYSSKRVMIDCNIFPGNSGGPVFSVINTGQAPLFYGIVSERRFSENELYSKNGRILDGKRAPIYSVESTAVGVIIPANKVRELLEYSESFLNKKN